MKMKRFNNREIVLFFIVLLFIIILLDLAAHRFDLQDLKNYLNSFGKWTPLVLLIFIIITSSIGFVFTMCVAVAALILGVYGAFFISVIGLTIGAAISFFIARYVGRDYVEKKYIHHVKKLEAYDQRLKRNGFLIMLFLRLITLIPFELINIVAGLSRIRFWPYISATFLGIMPGALLTIYFVATTKNLWSLQFFMATIFIVSFSLAPLLSKRIREIVFNLKKKKN